MKLIKIKEMSIPGAMLLSALIISLSIFITTCIFFGGENNKQKFNVRNQTSNNAPKPNPLTPEQIKKIQEQRDALLNKQQTQTPAVQATSTTTKK